MKREGKRGPGMNGGGLRGRMVAKKGRGEGKDGARKSKTIVSWMIIRTFSVQNLCLVQEI